MLRFNGLQRVGQLSTSELNLLLLVGRIGKGVQMEVAKRQRRKVLKIEQKKVPGLEDLSKTKHSWLAHLHRQAQGDINI